MPLEYDPAAEEAGRRKKQEAVFAAEAPKAASEARSKAAALIGAKIGAEAIVQPKSEEEIAINNLVKLGYSDNDIISKMAEVDDQTVKLANSNLSEDEILKQVYTSTTADDPKNPNRKFFLFKPLDQQQQTQKNDLPIEPVPLEMALMPGLAGAKFITKGATIAGQAIRAGAIGGAAGAVSPFEERLPFKEAIKEVPKRAAIGAGLYAGGELATFGAIQGGKYVYGKARDLLVKNQLAKKAAKDAAAEAQREIITPGFGTVGESAERIGTKLTEAERLRASKEGGQLVKGELAVEEATTPSKASQLFEKKPELKVSGQEVITPGFGTKGEASERFGTALFDQETRDRLVDTALRSPAGGKLLKQELADKEALGKLTEQSDLVLSQIDAINKQIEATTKEADLAAMTAKPKKVGGVDITPITKTGIATGPLEKRLEYLNRQLSDLTRQTSNITQRLSPVRMAEVKPQTPAEIIGGGTSNIVKLTNDLNETAAKINWKVGEVAQVADGRYGIVRGDDIENGLLFVETSPGKVETHSLRLMREKEIQRIASEPSMLGGNEDRIVGFSAAEAKPNKYPLKVDPQQAEGLSLIKNEDAIQHFNPITASTDTQLPFHKATNKMDVEGLNVAERNNGSKIIDMMVETKLEGVQPPPLNEVMDKIPGVKPPDPSKLSPDGGYVPPGTRVVASPREEGELFHIADNVRPQLGDMALSKSNGRFGAVTHVDPETGKVTISEFAGTKYTPTGRKIPQQFTTTMDDLSKIKVESPKSTKMHNWRPLWQTMDFLEKQTGLPFNSVFHTTGNRASTEAIEMKRTLLSKRDSIFKDLTSWDKPTIKLRQQATEILETNIERINPDGTIKVRLDSGAMADMPREKVAAALRKNDKATNAAIELRNAYDDYVRAGFIGEEDRRLFYSPRSPAKSPEDMFKYAKDPRIDQLARFEHERTGTLGNRETDAMINWQKYIGDWAQAEFLFPWENDIGRPLLAQISNNPKMQGFVNDYINRVRGVPNRATVDFNESIYNFVNDTLGYFHPEAAEQFINAFGKERIGEVLGRKWSNAQFKNLLGWRPTPYLVQHTQKLLAIPVIGEGGLAKGFVKSKTKAGQARALVAGIEGSFTDLLERGVIDEKGFIKKGIEKMTGREINAFTPGKWFQGADANNRASVYNHMHDDVLKAYKNGARTFDQLKEVSGIHFDMLPDSIVNKFKDLYNQGKVYDVLEKGTSNNAAHFIGYWGQWVTQFPNAASAGLQQFGKSPGWGQAGVLQSYMPFFIDYTAKMTKQALRSENKTADLFRLGRTMGYLTALEAGHVALTGTKLWISPASSLRIGLSPSLALGASAGTFLVSDVLQRVESKIIDHTEQKFVEFERAKNRNQLLQGLVGAAGIAPSYAAYRGYKFLEENF